MNSFVPRIWLDATRQACGLVNLRQGISTGCFAQPPRTRIGAYTSGFV
jgi:hypothetical protein